MTQIDQAFIHAYKSESVSPPVEQFPPATPHVSLRKNGVNLPPTASTVMAPEPIPAPHFQIAGPDDPSPHYHITAIGDDSSEITQTLEHFSNGRRPLSTFSAPEPAATTVFQPVYEVDEFRWPTVVNHLLATSGRHLHSVVEQLLQASEEGRSMVGISGTHSGVGCSTVMMCLARMIAGAGKSIAMADGAFATATLAKELGLEFDSGWEDALEGRLPLAECVVHSIQDGISLLPLRERIVPATDLLSGIQTSVSAGVLRYHYDLVLFDLGSAAEGEQHAVAEQIVEHCRLDASIIVADSSIDAPTAVEHIQQLMALFGQTCLGLVGNNAHRQ